MFICNKLKTAATLHSRPDICHWDQNAQKVHNLQQNRCCDKIIYCTKHCAKLLTLYKIIQCVWHVWYYKNCIKLNLCRLEKVCKIILYLAKVCGGCDKNEVWVEQTSILLQLRITSLENIQNRKLFRFLMTFLNRVSQNYFCLFFFCPELSLVQNRFRSPQKISAL